MKKYKFGYLLNISVVITGLLSMSNNGQAQTYQFNQYYNTFQILNPAFVGTSGLRYKGYSIIRNQWRRVTENTTVPYQTYAFSGAFTFGHPSGKSRNYDLRQSVKNTYWSFGLSGIYHNQANGSLNSTSVLTSLSVLQRIGENLYIGVGVEVNVNEHRLDDFVFVNDYLNGNFGSNSSITESNSNLSTGLILISKRAWIGVSLKDMTELPFSNNDGILVNESNSFYDNIYLHGGLSIPLKPEHDLYFTSSASYKQERQNRQVEFGAGVVFAFQTGYTWSGTISYRGLGRVNDLRTRDAVMGSLGFNIPNFLIGRIIKPEKNNPEKYTDAGSIGIGLSADIFHTQFDKDDNVGDRALNVKTWEISLIFNAPTRKKSQNQARKYCEDYLHGPLAEQLTRNLYGGLAPYEKRKKNPRGENISGEKENTKDIERRNKKKEERKKRKKRNRSKKRI